VPSKRPVRWAKGAEADLVQLVEYIANDSLQNALACASRLRDAAAQLAVFPNRGRVIPELEAQGVTQYREIIEGPWRILYRVYEKVVMILAVVDSRKNIEDILLARMVR